MACVVLLFDELPRTATGKLQRFRIRELAIAGITGTPGIPVPAASAG